MKFYFLVKPKFYFGEALHVLKSCSQWPVENKLSLHPGKTKCILFGTRKKHHTINSTENVKYLDVFIAQFFDWRIYYRAYHTNIKSQVAF